MSALVYIAVAVVVSVLQEPSSLVVVVAAAAAKSLTIVSVVKIKISLLQSAEFGSRMNNVSSRVNE